MRENDKIFEYGHPVVLGEKEFERLSKFIISQYGIKMPAHKKVFLQSRLQKRLRDLNIKDFKEYTDFVFSPQGKIDELSKMIDAVSTNKTDFFREPVHFNYLLSQGLTEFATKMGKKNLSIWSAGCSTGEEPYTIAMVIREFSRIHHNFNFNILATDISNSVLQHAAVGIYNMDKINAIPAIYHTHLQKGTGEYENKFRIISEIRNKVVFKKFNFLDKEYKMIGKYDIIFCRNALIYFEREIQYQILVQLCRHLSVGGYLFLGHSESITGFDLPLIPVKPTIFKRADL